MARQEELVFGVLGPLEVWAGARPVALAGAKQRALLAVLVLHRNEAVSADRLIDAVWGEASPPSASHLVQVYVSQLRKILPPDAAGEPRLVRQAPGYALRVDDREIDVARFEQLLEDASGEQREGRSERAVELLREALGLWRGDPLADFAFDAFAQSEIARLDELRLLAAEERIDAELTLGRHDRLIGELEALIGRSPLRERLRGQLMLALYRCGRQAEALETYQETRTALVEQLGIDPGPALQRLERMILQQDSSLELAVAVPPPRAAPQETVDAASLPIAERTVLIVPRASANLDDLIKLAEPLGRSRPPHELVLARPLPVRSAALLGEVTDELQRRRVELMAAGAPARAAAFTSEDPVEDIARLAAEEDTDLLLLDAELPLAGSGSLIAILARAPCDVGILLARPGANPDGAFMVPFGGTDHDWSALEVAAWMARAHGAPLIVLGTVIDAAHGRRDASRLLATASFLVQRHAGIAAEPQLIEPGPDAVVAAAATARLLTVGLSDRWGVEGFGAEREEIARASTAPVLLIRRGARPGGLSPRREVTRFAWSRA